MTILAPKTNEEECSGNEKKGGHKKMESVFCEMLSHSKKNLSNIQTVQNGSFPSMTALVQCTNI